MFWSAVLPFQITCVVLAVLWTAALWSAPRWRLKRWPVAIAGVAVCVVGVCPLFVVIDGLLQPFRFDVFEFATQAEIQNDHVARRIPPAATDLTVDDRPAGFSARYTIPEADLHDWLEREWMTARRFYESRDGRPMIGPEPPRPADPEEFARRFGALGWPMPPDTIRLDGPHAPNGSGYNVWYSPATGVAYQEAGYG